MDASEQDWRRKEQRLDEGTEGDLVTDTIVR
jgi:hypothetical protein